MEREFWEAVNGLILSTVRTSIATTAIMAEVRKFNAKSSLALAPYGLCIYGCLLQLQFHFPGHEIEFVLDKFDNSASRAALGLKYVASHVVVPPVRPDLMTPIPLQKGDSWKTVSPLQIADYIAWEVRKHRRERSSFKPPKKMRPDRERVHKLATQWDDVHRPRYRGNFAALVMSTLIQPRHSVADFVSLQLANTQNHPNGWGV